MKSVLQKNPTKKILASDGFNNKFDHTFKDEQKEERILPQLALCDRKNQRRGE